MTLGTATLAALALAVILLAALILRTLLDAIVELVQTVANLYSHGDPLTRLLLPVFILFLIWKVAPRIVRYIRRQIAAAPALFSCEEAIRAQTVNAGPYREAQSHKAQAIGQQTNTTEGAIPMGATRSTQKATTQVVHKACGKDCFPGQPYKPLRSQVVDFTFYPCYCSTSGKLTEECAVSYNC